MNTLIKNGTIVNEGLSYKGSLLINGGYIKKIFKEIPENEGYNEDIAECQKSVAENGGEIIDASGLHILPGVIDDQVHFREPGGEQKATIESESKAAILGGVTSFMDMPKKESLRHKTLYGLIYRQYACRRPCCIGEDICRISAPYSDSL